MTIRTLIENATIEKGTVLEALLSPDENEAVVYDSKGFVQFYGPGKFQCVAEEDYDLKESLIRSYEDEQDIPKVYGNKYTLSELKEIKELFNGK